MPYPFPPLATWNSHTKNLFKFANLASIYGVELLWYAVLAWGAAPLTLPGPLSVDDVLKLERDLKGKYTLYWQQVTNGQHFFPNVEREPWRDVRLSKALSLTTDRHEIQKAFGAGER